MNYFIDYIFITILTLRPGTSLVGPSCDEMELILKSKKPKRLMGLRVDHGGFTLANSLEWRSVVVVS